MGPQSAKITIVTVVRNGVDDLEQTIESVLSQEYGNLDYIIIDGASTDGTINIIERYEARLKAWLSEPDQGIYDAMNKGWSLADNSYVLFLGCGDRILSLPKTLPAENAPDVVYGHVLLDEYLIFKSSIGPQIRIFNSLHHQALLIKKCIHTRPPFNLNFPRYADFDFNQRLFKSKASFAFSSDLKAFAKPGGVTQELCLDESLNVIRKNFGCFWGVITVLVHRCLRLIPLLKCLRPIKTVKN